VPSVWHLAKPPLTVALPAALLYFAESVPAHGKALPSAREKALGKDGFAVNFFAECCLPSVALGKPFAECKMAFTKCSRHSANLLCPVVSTSSLQATQGLSSGKMQIKHIGLTCAEVTTHDYRRLTSADPKHEY